MATFNFSQLPIELVYLIFSYMRKTDAIFAFYELNERFATAIRFFVGDSLDLRNVSTAVTLYVLNRIGSQIQDLILGDQSFDIPTGQDYLTKYCVNLETLDIFCTTTHHDIRDYLAFVHRNLESFSVAQRYVRLNEKQMLRTLFEKD